MTNTAYTPNYATEGSSALAPKSRKLRLIQGDYSTTASQGQIASRNVVERREQRTRAGSHAPSHDLQLVAESHPSLQAAQKIAVGIVAFVLVLILGFVWFATDVQASDAYSSRAAQAQLEQVIVHSGDTLWSIAKEHQVEGLSTEDVIRLIQQANQLESAEIFVGDRLMVPVNA